MLFGAALIGVGVYGYVDTGSKHPTALIPAALGLAIALAGAVALRGGAARKHAMHAAAAIALVGAVMTVMGVADFVKMMTTSESQQVADAVSKATTPQEVRAESERKRGSFMAAVSKTGTFALCAVFVGLCVKSFVDARIARQGAASSSEPAPASPT
jgi:hypothetical protein